MSGLRVRREKAALSSGCKSHPANAPAGSNRSSHGGTAVTPHGGIRGGESQQWLSYPTNPPVRFDERGVETELRLSH
jgi:hypothetical protein